MVGEDVYVHALVCVLALTCDEANIYFIYIFMPRIKKIYADFVTFFRAILQTFFSHYCLLSIHDFVFYSSLSPPPFRAEIVFTVALCLSA